MILLPPKLILRKVLLLKLSDLIKTNKINYDFSSPIITVCDEHDLFNFLKLLKIANSSIFNMEN